MVHVEGDGRAIAPDQLDAVAVEIENDRVPGAAASTISPTSSAIATGAAAGIATGPATVAAGPATIASRAAAGVIARITAIAGTAAVPIVTGIAAGIVAAIVAGIVVAAVRIVAIVIVIALIGISDDGYTIEIRQFIPFRRSNRHSDRRNGYGNGYKPDHSLNRRGSEQSKTSKHGESRGDGWSHVREKGDDAAAATIRICCHAPSDQR
jgi:hypothetical protein